MEMNVFQVIEQAQLGMHLKPIIVAAECKSNCFFYLK
jgi:hypothetical protein